MTGGDDAGGRDGTDRPDDTERPDGTDRRDGRDGTGGQVIQAAGCVLWRPAAAGDGIELALVHRPKWQDWSLPKGKLKRGEGAREAAVREVREETGRSCVLGPELPSVCYDVAGRPKHVRYWAAEATGGTFTPGREVDRLWWLPPGAARARLTRPADRQLVDALIGTLDAGDDGTRP